MSPEKIPHHMSSPSYEFSPEKLNNNQKIVYFCVMVSALLTTLSDLKTARVLLFAAYFEVRFSTLTQFWHRPWTNYFFQCQKYVWQSYMFYSDYFNLLYIMFFFSGWNCLRKECLAIISYNHPKMIMPSVHIQIPLHLFRILV